MKSLPYIIISFFLLVPPALADDRSVAEELIRNKLEAVVSVLQQKDLAKEVKKKKIIEIVEPIFDFSLMAKLALGRKHWPELPPQKRETYNSLFTQRLKDSFLEKMTLYTDETIEYQNAVESRKKVHMLTHIISKDKKIPILYKLYKSPEGWKIYDFEIEGVSIIASYRSQFDEILATGTINDLLDKLEHPEEKKSSGTSR